MGWDDSEEKSKKSGIFVGLSDGESLEFAIVGEPEVQEEAWVDGKSEPYNPKTHAGIRPTTRYVVNVFVPDSGMKIWKMSGGTFKQLLLMRKKISLDKRMVEITRIGSGKDTTYAVGKGEDITDAIRAEIKAAERHDLGVPAKTEPASDECPF